MSDSETSDLAIIGSGPSGQQAAMSSDRRRLPPPQWNRVAARYAMRPARIPALR
jgi:hypothetical protein